MKAKRALVVLAELNRRKVWVDERTANAICNACFHKVPRFVTYLFLVVICSRWFQKVRSKSLEFSILPH